MGVPVVFRPNRSVNVLRSQGLVQRSISDEITDFGSVVKSVAKGERFLNRCLSAGSLYDLFGFLKREFVQVDLTLGLSEYRPFWVT